MSQRHNVESAQHQDKKEESQMDKVRVIVWGVGGVGSGAVKMMSDKEWIEIEIVGAVDIAKEKVGRDVGDVAGTGSKLGVIVSDEPDAVFAKTKADMVLHWPFSLEDEMEAQIMKSIEAKSNVITIADLRLAYPWVHWPELGRRIDEAARKNGVTVLSTGLIPGLLMDLLPIALSGACAYVRKISLKRTVDYTNRSAAMMARHGIGLTPDEFQKGVVDGSVGWGVLRQILEIDMVADALGWKLDETRDKVEPIISKKKKIARRGVEVEPGMACGAHYLFSGIKDGEAVITIDRLTTLIGPEEEGLEVETAISIEGEPNIDVVMKGFRGEVAYASAVNRIPQVMEAGPGLVTVKDLPVVACLK